MQKPYWNPYLAGTGLGLVLLLSYLVLGTGLGASGALTRVAAATAHAIAPAAVENNAYLSGYFTDGGPFANYLVPMLLGVLIGGGLSALAARRTGITIERGPTASVSRRVFWALVGGALIGIGARMAGGCTSGLALSGGAMLQIGAFTFIGATFAAGFAFAPLVKKEWR